MAKVLFINPVIREKDVPRHVPYGMGVLASLAMNAGHLVQVYDANAWRLGDDVLRQVLEADDWDVVAAGGITTTSCGFSPTWISGSWGRRSLPLTRF